MCYDEIVWLKRLEGWLLVPHEMLHVFAYRLIGKRCHYRVSNLHVARAEPLMRRERIFVLLLPTAVSGTVCIVLAVAWAVSAYLLAKTDSLYPQRMPLWHAGLLTAFAVSFVYAGAGWMDILTAAALLRGHQKTPYEPPDKADEHQDERQSPQRRD